MNRETSIGKLLLKGLDIFALAQADLNFTEASANITNLILINCCLNDMFNPWNLFEMSRLRIRWQTIDNQLHHSVVGWLPLLDWWVLLIEVCVLKDLACKILDLQSLGWSITDNAGSKVSILACLGERASLNFWLIIVQVERWSQLAHFLSHGVEIWGLISFQLLLYVGLEPVASCVYQSHTVTELTRIGGCRRNLWLVKNIWVGVIRTLKLLVQIIHINCRLSQGSMRIILLILIENIWAQLLLSLFVGVNFAVNVVELRTCSLMRPVSRSPESCLSCRGVVIRSVRIFR
jgi:hypothetical protein